MYYSATTNSAYDNPQHYQDFPADAVEITDESYRQCFTERPSDKIVVPGPYGYPELADRPGPSSEELARIAREKRDRILAERCDTAVMIIAREIRLAGTDETKVAELNAKMATVDSYALALLNIPQQPGFPTTIEWPEEPTL